MIFGPLSSCQTSPPTRLLRRVSWGTGLENMEYRGLRLEISNVEFVLEVELVSDAWR